MPVGSTGGEVGDAWQRNEKESEKRVNDYFTLPSTANTPTPSLFFRFGLWLEHLCSYQWEYPQEIHVQIGCARIEKRKNRDYMQENLHKPALKEDFDVTTCGKC